MTEWVQPMADGTAAGMELLGIGIIIVLALHALLAAVWRLWNEGMAEAVYAQLRQRLGHGILLGLEFLVAADIIHTVAVELTFETLGLLAVIVLIRTFLSFSLQLELTGRWPWQERDGAGEV